jgi:hypothetical protein
LKPKLTYFLSFVIFSIVLGFLLEQFSVFTNVNQPPAGLHAWRQTDCASLAYLYAEEDRSFFDPAIHSQTSDFLETGDCAPSEAPILFYWVGKCYQWFGVNEAYFRLTTLALFIIALLSLFAQLFNLQKQFFESALPILFWISSPILLYYSNNFLSNMSGLSMAAIAFGFGYSYIQTQRSKHLALACVFFAIAGLFKVTALLGLMAFLLAFVVDALLSKKSIFNRKLLWIMLAFVPTAAWIFYAKWYNAAHLCHYFSTQTFPIWELDLHGIQYHLELIAERWKGQFYPTASLVVLATSIVLIFVRIKRINRLFLLWLLFASLGTLAYLAMQFQVLFAHDYYFTNLFILPLMLMVEPFKTLSNISNKWLKLGVGIALFVCLGFAINDSKSQAEKRFLKFEDVTRERLMKLEPWLTRVGVKPSDKVVFATDESNVSLYYIKRKGWTQYGYPIDENGNMSDSENYAFRLTVMAKHHAAYLLLYADDALERFPELELHKGAFVADTAGLSVYHFMAN